jgi:hypothetical protein
MSIFQVVVTLSTGERITGYLNARNEREVRHLVRSTDDGRKATSVIVSLSY